MAEKDSKERILTASRPLKKNWYALYTASRAEKAAASRMEALGAEVFLPTYIEKRKWSDRIKKVELPLFRSYVFVHCNEYELRKYALAQGVARIVYYLGKPAVIRDEEIMEVRKFLKITEDSQIVSEGDMVQILGGPFEKRYGEVTRVGNRFVYLCIRSAGEITVCANIRIDRELISK